MVVTGSGVAAYDPGMTDVGLARFNELPAERAAESVRLCCASSAWVTAMVAGRPYAERAPLLTASVRVLAELDWADVGEALAAHPRIGERVSGGGQEATWSRREQSGMDQSTAEVRQALFEANQAYEDRFGHVFLIFATGRTDVDMLVAARARVGNDQATEQGVVRQELTRIVDRRLTNLLDSWAQR